MTSLVKHLHGFVHEVRPTWEELLVGIQFLTAVGQKCGDKRPEFILLSDTLGVSTLLAACNRTHRVKRRGPPRGHRYELREFPQSPRKIPLAPPLPSPDAGRREPRNEVRSRWITAAPTAVASMAMVEEMACEG